MFFRPMGVSRLLRDVRPTTYTARFCNSLAFIMTRTGEARRACLQIDPAPARPREPAGCRSRALAADGAAPHCRRVDFRSGICSEAYRSWMFSRGRIRYAWLPSTRISAARGRELYWLDMEKA